MFVEDGEDHFVYHTFLDMVADENATPAKQKKGCHDKLVQL